MTQPTSEALSEKELAELNRQVGAIVGFDYDPLRKDILTVGKTKRLLATLDQALARCEAAEARAEALLDPKPDHHFAPRDEGGHNCIVCDEDSIWKCDAAAHMEIVPRWEDDPVVVSQGWNTPERCGNCGEVNERLVARCELAERRVDDMTHPDDGESESCFICDRGGPVTQPTSEALSDEQLKMLRRNAVFALPFRHDNPPLATDRDITDDGRSAEFWHVIPLLDALDQALARCEAAERRAQLDPTENMVLTIALAQIERGDDVPPNTTAALVFALARIAGREGFDAVQPEPDTGGVET